MIPKEMNIRSFFASRGMAACFVLAILVLSGISWMVYQDMQEGAKTKLWVNHTYEVISEIGTVRSKLADAEASQRGYLITGDENYLDVYTKALASVKPSAERIVQLTDDNPNEHSRAVDLQNTVEEKLTRFSEGINLRRKSGFESARLFVLSGVGKKQMDKIRDLADEMERTEKELLKQRTEESNANTDWTLITFSAGLLVSFVLLVIAFLMLNQQIVVRRRTEEALTAALEKEHVLAETAADVICTINAEGLFTAINPACEKIWGYRPEEMIGRPFVDFIVPGDIDRSNDAAVRIFAGETETDFENRYIHKNGSAVPVMWSATWSETQKLMFCIARDITERKLAQEKLEKFAAELERSNSELQDFAAVASHDLQEPLRKIQSFADELKTSIGASLDEEDSDTLDRMIAAAGRMRTLINDLLAFSRVTTKAKPFATVDLGTVVSEVLSDLEARTKDTGGHIEVGHLPTIDADPMQMRQLFQNLIGNGLKFHRPGIAPVITVNGQNGGSQCNLTIADNGIGFDEKYLDRIFTVFQRLHGRNEFEGTGIGLAICRKIVERHGGEITATSIPGEGSTFSVTLPTKQKKERKQ